MPNKGTFPNRQYFIDNTNHAEPNKDFRWIERKGQVEPNKGSLLQLTLPGKEPNNGTFLGRPLINKRQ